MDALILSCGTGGGHDVAACAIKEELMRCGHRTVMLNPYLLHSRQTVERINRAYISLVQNAPKLFGMIYQLGEWYRGLPWRSPIYYLNYNMVPILRDYLEHHHFDIIIMTHFFPAEILTQMRCLGYKTPKTILVATDYTCVPFSEETDCDAYVIPAKELLQEFQHKGIPPDKIFPLGIPVRSAFFSQLSKEDARKKLDMEMGRKYLLISGGSIGAGKLIKAVRLLYAQGGGNTRLVVICGSNETVYKKLLTRYRGKIRILQKTDQIATYLQASDLYLTKPGGLSSTEAAVIGIPLAHLPPIPGCETKNAAFFAIHGMSRRIKTTRKDIAEIIAFMEKQEPCREMILRQHEVIDRNSALKICKLASNLVHEDGTLEEKKVNDG